MRTEFVDEPFTAEIKDGNMVVSWSDGFRLSMPIRVARENMARCQQALNEYDRGRVVRFPRKSPGRRGKDGD